MSEPVLDRVRVREVVGIFRSEETVQRAISALLLAGIDRADIDVLAGSEAIETRLGTARAPIEDIADAPWLTRGTFFAPEEKTLVAAMAAGVLAFIGAAIAIVISLKMGSTILQAVIVGLLAGSALGSVGYYGLNRLFEEQQRRRIRAWDLAGGCAVWIRAHNPRQESTVMHILKERGSEAVRVHEIELRKTPKDIPLGDTLLGGERIGDV